MKKFSFGKPFMALAMLALALALGLAFVGCSNDTTNDTANEGPGVLTVTNIPSEYNGKYAYFMYTDDRGKTPIYGYGSNYSTLPQIKNGSVDLSLKTSQFDDVIYEGTETLPAGGYYLFFNIYDNATSHGTGGAPLLRRIFPSISFVNGRGTVSFTTATIRQ